MAWTVLVNVPGTVPAVNRPAPSMVPPPATTDQVGAIGTTLPPASLPTAVNCCVPSMASVAGLGVTVMVASGPGGHGHGRRARRRAPLVARTVLVIRARHRAGGEQPAAGDGAAAGHDRPGGRDRRPRCRSASLPTAVNCCVPLMASVAGLGVTVMLASGPAVTVTVAAPESAPLVACTVLV